MLTGVLVLLSLAQSGSGSPEALARGAHEDFQAGRFAQAREKLRNAVKASPRNPALWSLLGMTDAQLEDVDSAIADFQKTLSLAPDDAQSYFNLGLLYGKKRDIGKATEAYQKGLRREPENTAANQNYALLLIAQERFREALEPLRLLRGKDARNFPVRVTLIECYLKAHLVDEAAGEIQSYLEIPDVPVNEQLKLAKVLLENNQAASAQAVLQNAVKTPPESPEAHYDLGVLYLNRNDFEKAVRELGRAAQMAPDPPQYSLRLAEALLLWKHYGTALDFLTAVKSRFGGLSDYQYKLGLAYYGLHRFPEAITRFEAILRDQPNLDLVHFFLGNSQFAVGSLEQSIAEFRKAIALQPRNAAYYTALAQSLRKLSDDNTDEAVTNLEKALALDGTDIQIKQELALCLEKKHDYARAQGLLEQVVAQAPQLVSAHVSLAGIYYKQRMKVEGDREREVVRRLQADEQARQSELRNTPKP
ncbi:MAG: tetratricopeptide repeat protein [Bryobacteraceae bacterium]